MTRDWVAIEITKYERVLEEAKRRDMVDYVSHLENLITELKAMQEMDKRIG